METRYNGFEGTEEFWLLNPNVVKSNYWFLVFKKKKRFDIKLDKQTYVLNDLQWLSCCAIGKQSKRYTDTAFDLPF